jgi:general secretion pathway protein G
MIDFDPSSPPRPALPVLEYAQGSFDTDSMRAWSRAKLGLEFMAATVALGLLAIGFPNPLSGICLLVALAGTLFAGTAAILNSGQNQAYRRRLSLFLGIVELGLAASILVALFVVPMPRPRGGGRLSACKTGISTFEAAVEQFNIDMDRYPMTAEGLAALVTPTEDPQKWRGPYVKSVPYDPWGNPYIYVFPGTHNPGRVDISSAGPDGKPGTEDDINNWP